MMSNPGIASRVSTKGVDDKDDKYLLSHQERQSNKVTIIFHLMQLQKNRFIIIITHYLM